MTRPSGILRYAARRARTFLGAAGLVALGLGGLAAARVDLALPWMIPACVMGLVMGAWAGGGRGDGSGIGALGGALLFAGFGMAIGLVPQTPLTGEVAGPLAPEDMAGLPHALGYRLDGARVATEFAAGRSYRGTRSGGAPVTWHAAPLVGAGWTVDRAVPAWIIAQETAGSDPHSESGRRSWDRPIAYVTRLGSPSSGRGPAVAELAASRHGLTSLPGAVMVMRSADPRADGQSELALLAGLFALALALHAGIRLRAWRLSRT